MPEIGPADIWFDPRKILPAAKNALMYPFTHPAQTAEFGLSVAPGSGEAMSAVDAWNASGRAGNALLSGNYGQAAGEYGNVLLGALGAIPGAGVIARGTKRGAAWMDRNLPSGVNRLLDAAMPSDPQNTLNAIPAWHGSPHDFEEFKLDKIGTGEGAQAYGHGLYFAENPDVAVAYRNNLTKGRSEIALDGVPLNDTPQTFVKTIDKLEAEGNWPLAKAINEVQSLMRPGEDLQTVLRDRRNWHANSPKMLAAFDEFERRAAVKAPPPGRLYHTELDVEPHDLLDWDKPLSQQSEKVRGALGGLFSRLKGKEVDDGFYGAFGGSGQSLYNLVSAWTKHTGDDTAKALREAGIPGIKYLDQGSRGAEGGTTSNYVIFDDKLVKVLKKE